MKKEGIIFDLNFLNHVFKVKIKIIKDGKYLIIKSNFHKPTISDHGCPDEQKHNNFFFSHIPTHTVGMLAERVFLKINLLA